MMENMRKYNSDSNLEDNSTIYQRCIYCNRTFNPDSFKRHQKVCYQNIIKGKQRQLTNQKSKRFSEDKFPNGDYVLITDLILRKKQRRNQWRNDHFDLLQHLQLEKKSRIFSENSSPVSSINSLDYNFDISDEIQWESKNTDNRNMEKQKINDKNSSDFIRKLENFDSEYFVIEAGDIPNYRKIKTPSKENNLTKPKQLSTQKQINSQIFPNKCLFSSRSIKDISENLSHLKATERINRKENSLLTKQNLFENESINKSKLLNTELIKNDISNLLKSKYNKLSHSNYELSKTTGHFSIGRLSPQNEKLNRYEERIRKVLQQYSENYRMNEKHYQQKVLENIPKNLSIHRQRLENLKQFNYLKKKQNNQFSGLKTNTFNCHNEILSNNNKETVDINNFNKINQNNFDNIDLNRINENGKSNKNDEILVKLNESLNLNKNKQSCKCIQLKSILKKKGNDFENNDANIIKLYKDNCNSVREFNDSEPFVNTKYNKFKEHQREINQINTELLKDNKNESLENKFTNNDNSNENIVTNLRANPNCLSMDNNSKIDQNKQGECIIEKYNNNSLEQKQLANEWKASKDISINSQWSKSTPDIQGIFVKPINQSEKHLQIDRNLSQCNISILRNQYAEAWKVKL